VFAWPGLGSAVVNAVLARDYPVVQAVVVILGAAVIVINAVVDVVLALTDRRSLVAES
jgi:peptide/nickel transport system permease protein